MSNDLTPPDEPNPDTPDGADALPSEGRIQPLDIRTEMQQSYLTYAMSVIVSRALPDVRDGLKPAQRRILVAMNDLNLGPSSGAREMRQDLRGHLGELSPRTGKA